MKHLLTCLLALSACTCSALDLTPKTDPSAPPPSSSVSPDCARACENLRRLGCPTGEPTKEGTTCETVCSDAQAAGIDLKPGCVAGARSCELAEGC